jgi:hypothetical protein
MSTRDLRNQLQERLKALDEEREAILEMLRLYGVKASNNDRGRSPPQVRKRKAPSYEYQREGPYEGPGGPTDTVLRVLASATQGLTYRELLKRATQIVNRTAKYSRATVSATIHELERSGKIVVREGRYFLE